MTNITLRILQFSLVLIQSLCLLSCKKTSIDSFNLILTESFEDYLVLNNEDIVLHLFIEISTNREDFIRCINCTKDELRYIDKKKLKSLFFKHIELNKENQVYRYSLRIDGISNNHKLKYIGRQSPDTSIKK